MKVMSKDNIPQSIKKFCDYLNGDDELVTLYDSLEEFNRFERSVTDKAITEKILQHLDEYKRLPEVEKQKVDASVSGMNGEQTLRNFFKRLSINELYEELYAQRKVAQSKAPQYEGNDVYYLVDTDFNSYPRGQMFIVAASTNLEEMGRIYKQETGLSNNGALMSVLNSKARVIQINASQMGE